jgi:hypothetical protein
MSITLQTNDRLQLVEVHVHGRLATEEYQWVLTELERMIIRHGRINVLFAMSRFHGWEIRALWNDLRFDRRHCAGIERLALVGEDRWQRLMAIFCRPLTSATIHCFSHDDTATARDWLGGILTPLNL